MHVGINGWVNAIIEWMNIRNIMNKWMNYRQTHREIQRQIGIHRQIDIEKADKLRNKQIERQAHRESVEGYENGARGQDPLV